MHTGRASRAQWGTIAVAAALGLAAGFGAGVAEAVECVVQTHKEEKDGLKILHFRNKCKFPVWAIVKNGDTGTYAVHSIEPEANHEEPGLKAFSQIVGWCKIDDRDCLREHGLK